MANINFVYRGKLSFNLIRIWIWIWMWTKYMSWMAFYSIYWIITIAIFRSGTQSVWRMEERTENQGRYKCHNKNIFIKKQMRNISFGIFRNGHRLPPSTDNDIWIPKKPSQLIGIEALNYGPCLSLSSFMLFYHWIGVTVLLFSIAIT